MQAILTVIFECKASPATVRERQDYGHRQRTTQRVANVLGNRRVVGEGPAQALRGLKSDQRVRVVLRTGCAQDRVIIRQQTTINGEMLLVDHDVSNRLQTELRRAVRETYKRGWGPSNDQFVFELTSASERSAPPKADLPTRDERIHFGQRNEPSLAAQ